METDETLSPDIEELCSQDKYSRVSCLLLWYPGSTECSQKVFCYKSEPDFWGFPGGITKPCEAYTDALKRIVTADCDFPEPVNKWIKKALSRPWSDAMTCITQRAHPELIPNGKASHHYTVRMYALKLPAHFASPAPQITMRKGWASEAYHNHGKELSAGWKYVGALAPKLASSQLSDMMLQLMKNANSSTPKNMSFARSATNMLRIKDRNPVIWDVFSGTGSVGSVFQEEFGWTLFSIDNDSRQARRSNAVCKDVLTFDFGKWPKPDLIWFSPPCTPWSNATPLIRRMSPEYLEMGKLCEFAINLALKVKPRGFILENPQHTKLANQTYMSSLKKEYCSYCQYGFPYRKDTTLWHSDSISLKLKSCNCTEKHAVKIGGDYGGKPGCKRYSKKWQKGKLPAPLVRSIAKQLMKQWNIGAKSSSSLQKPSPNKNSSIATPLGPDTRGALIGNAFMGAIPDTGSTRSVLTEGAVKV